MTILLCARSAPLCEIRITKRQRLVDAEAGVLLAAQAISHISFGALADRWGHEQILEFAPVLGLIALLVTVLARTALWFFPIFALVGAAQAVYRLTGFT